MGEKTDTIEQLADSLDRVAEGLESFEFTFGTRERTLFEQLINALVKEQKNVYVLQCPGAKPDENPLQPVNAIVGGDHEPKCPRFGYGYNKHVGEDSRGCILDEKFIGYCPYET